MTRFNLMFPNFLTLKPSFVVILFVCGYLNLLGTSYEDEKAPLPLYEEGKVWEYVQPGGINPSDYIFHMKFGNEVTVNDTVYRKFYVCKIEDINKEYSYETNKMTYSIGRTHLFDDHTRFYLIREEGSASYILELSSRDAWHSRLIHEEDFDFSKSGNEVPHREKILYDFDAPIGAMIDGGEVCKGRVEEIQEEDFYGTRRIIQNIELVDPHQEEFKMNISEGNVNSPRSFDLKYVEGIGTIKEGNVGCPFNFSITGDGFNDVVASYRSHLHRVYNELTGETYYGSEVPYMEYFMTGPNSVHEIEDSLNIDFDGRFLYLPGDHKAKNVEIYSLTGKRMLSASNATQIDLSSLPKGAYVVSVKSGNGTHVMKIAL